MKQYCKLENITNTNNKFVDENQSMRTLKNGKDFRRNYVPQKHIVYELTLLIFRKKPYQKLANI